MPLKNSDKSEPINNRQRTPGVSPGMNALMSATLMPFLTFQGSRPDLFNDLSAGEFCPLRIPPIDRGLRFPPLISREKDVSLSPSLLNFPKGTLFNRASHSDKTSRPALDSKCHGHKPVGIYSFGLGITASNSSSSIGCPLANIWRYFIISMTSLPVIFLVAKELIPISYSP